MFHYPLLAELESEHQLLNYHLNTLEELVFQIPDTGHSSPQGRANSLSITTK